MGGALLAPGYEDEWAEMIVSLLYYARNTRHLQFNLVAPDNEPDATPSGHYGQRLRPIRDHAARPSPLSSTPTT